MSRPAPGEYSITVNTAEGGVLPLYPQGDADMGTSGRIEVPPQPGPPTEVTVTASLFGVPGQADETTAGNVAVGQGIEWSVDDPGAIVELRVTFLESPALTRGGRAEEAIAYKDGVAVEDARLDDPDREPPKPSIIGRSTDSEGGWEITFLVDGTDPKGRI